MSNAENSAETVVPPSGETTQPDGAAAGGAQVITTPIEVTQVLPAATPTAEPAKAEKTGLAAFIDDDTSELELSSDSEDGENGEQGESSQSLEELLGEGGDDSSDSDDSDSDSDSDADEDSQNVNQELNLLETLKEENDEAIIDLFSKKCLNCSSLVPWAEKSYRQCHFSQGNENCPAQSIKIQVRIPYEDIIPRFLAAEEQGDMGRLARLYENLSKKPDWVQTAIQKRLTAVKAERLAAAQ